MGNRLLIVSNRLPVTIREERGVARLVPSAGGLATALREPHEQSGGLWFGWPGDLPGGVSGERQEIEAALRELRAVPIAISAREIASAAATARRRSRSPCRSWAVDAARTRHSLTVGEVAQALPGARTFSQSTRARSMLEAASDSSWQATFPVLDDSGQILGVVASRALHVVASEDGMADWIVAGDVMEKPVVAHGFRGNANPGQDKKAA